jgi:hypothetical protein
MRYRSSPVLPANPQIKFVITPVNKFVITPTNKFISSNILIPPMSEPHISTIHNSPLISGVPSPRYYSPQSFIHPHQITINNRPVSNLNNPITFSIQREQTSPKNRAQSSINSI